MRRLECLYRLLGLRGEGPSIVLVVDPLSPKGILRLADVGTAVALTGAGRAQHREVCRVQRAEAADGRFPIPPRSTRYQSGPASRRR